VIFALNLLEQNRSRLKKRSTNYRIVNFTVVTIQKQTKPSNLSLYSPYYAEVWNELAVPFSASWRQGNTASYLRRCWSGGEPFATLCKIRPNFGIQTLDLPHTRHAR